MRRALLIALILLIPPGVTAVVSEFDLGEAIANRLRYPKRYAEVEKGQLFRGAYPSAQDLRNLKKDKNIRTIVSLTGRVDEQHEREMLAEVERLGLRPIRFPMPGNGCGDFSSLDMAADAIQNPANRPVFFHCQAGKQRSNAALAAYRMRHCGWTLEEALDELLESYDLDPTTKEMALVEHLTKYAKHLGLDTSDDADRAGDAEK